MRLEANAGGEQKHALNTLAVPPTGPLKKLYYFKSSGQIQIVNRPKHSPGRNLGDAAPVWQW